MNKLVRNMCFHASRIEVLMISTLGIPSLDDSDQVFIEIMIKTLDSLE